MRARFPYLCFVDALSVAFPSSDGGECLQIPSDFRVYAYSFLDIVVLRISSDLSHGILREFIVSSGLSAYHAYGRSCAYFTQGTFSPVSRGGIFGSSEFVSLVSIFSLVLLFAPCRLYGGGSIASNFSQRGLSLRFRKGFQVFFWGPYNIVLVF